MKSTAQFAKNQYLLDLEMQKGMYIKPKKMAYININVVISVGWKRKRKQLNIKGITE